MGRSQTNRGQAVIEYILLIVLVAVTIAVAIRNTNLTVYCFWSGLARQVASPCAECTTPPAPNADICAQALNPAGP